ncbi:MAG: four helix bundle protein [Chloroflexota bacterium]
MWRRSVEFADAIFVVADSLPKRYQFSLADQLRRAALSIPTNIAEGTGRDGLKERKYFFRVAKGSVYEVVSLLIMSVRRGYVDDRTYGEHYKEANEIAAILTALARK